MKLKQFMGLLAVGTAFAAPANASYFQYVLTGSYTADWRIGDDWLADFADAGVGIGFADVGGDFAVIGDGTYPSPNTQADINFYNAGVGGGLELVDFYDTDGNGPDEANHVFLSVLGPQLYGGTEGASGFNLLTGIFALEDEAGNDYSLAVSFVDTSAVPEPATWAMMIAGFGMVGGAMRSRTVRAGSRRVSFNA